MSPLFSAPELDLTDNAVIEEIDAVRQSMASLLRAPRRWSGGLRRTTQARAIQGSNTIEGYTVTDQDAAAAVEGEPPLSADERTWAEIIGYRRVLTYVLQMAGSPGFVVDLATIRAMHFMLLEHDLAASPGRFRESAVYVRDERSGGNVYEGPDDALVPALMDELAASLARTTDGPALVRAAMAHLNLVMIHPFRDGNGRMARALQTLVLAQDSVIEPTFSSIEEWLGHNTEDYYRVLAVTGGGAWHPENDAHLWVKFNLRAHHMQAQTLRHRFDEADRLWSVVDDMVRAHRLPDRTADALFEAMLGFRVTRPAYLKRTQVEQRTGTRDLARLAELGLLTGHGQTRARYYTAGEPLRQARAAVRSQRAPLADPYPDLVPRLRAAADR